MNKASTICLTLLAPAALLAAYTVKTDEQIIGALDWIDHAGTAEVTEGPWKKCGVFLEQTETFETEASGRIGIFPGKLPCEDGAPWFYYVKNDNGYTLAMMEADGTKRLLSSDGSTGFSLTGLESGVGPVQPEVFKLGENRYRMYFWGYRWPDRNRYLVAESTDLHHWSIVNGGEPVLCVGGGDVYPSQGWPSSLVCNDATTVYRLPDGTWEFLSAAMANIKSPSPYFGNPKCPGNHVRIVQRWTSADGLSLSEPQVVLAPDDRTDPVEQQFYHLTATDLEPYTVGFVGDFDAAGETLTIEPVWSRDHIHWNRPLRNRRILWQDDVLCYSPMADLAEEENGMLTLYYDASNADHAGKTVDGGPRVKRVLKAQVHRRKFFGRILASGVTVASPTLRFTGSNPRIFIAPGTTVSCEWRDLFSTSSGPVTVTYENDVAVVHLSDAIAPGDIGTLFVSGSGTIYDASTAVYEDVDDPDDPDDPEEPEYPSSHCIGRWDFDNPDDLLRATIGQPLAAGKTSGGVSVRQSGTGDIAAVAEPPANTLGVDFGGVAVVPSYAHLIPTDTFTPEVAAGDFTYRMVAYLPNGRAESDFWCMFWSGENKDGVGYTKTDGTFGGGTFQDSGDPKYITVPGILDNWHEFRFVYTQQGDRLAFYMDGEPIRSAGNISTDSLVRIFGDNDGEDNAVYIASLELFDTADQSKIPSIGTRYGIVTSPCPVVSGDGKTVAAEMVFELPAEDTFTLVAPERATLEDSPGQTAEKVFRSWRVTDAATGAELQTSSMPTLVFDLASCTARKVVFETAYETASDPCPPGQHLWDGTSGNGLQCVNCDEHIAAAANGGTASWPVREPFEEFTVGTVLAGYFGWTGGGTVSSGTPTLPKYSRPLPNDAHEKLLAVPASAPAVRRFTPPAATDLKFDLLTRARRTETSEFMYPSEAKFAVAFDGNGQLLVWAKNAEGTASWLPTGAVFENNEWIRFQGEWNRTSVPGSEFIRLRANSNVVTNASCVAISPGEPAPLSSTCWFRVVTDGTAPSSFESADSTIDDLRVMPATDAFASDPSTHLFLQ